MKIFDIHTHIYPEAIASRACENLGKFYNIPIYCDGTYNGMEFQAAKCGISGFLIFTVATNAHQVEKINEITAELIRFSRNRGFDAHGFGCIHQDIENYEQTIKKIKSLGLEGIKIHPDIQKISIDDPRLMRIYEIVEGDIPIYFHMGDERPQYNYSSPEKLARVKKIFPNLEVVAAHLGGHKQWDAAQKYLIGLDKIWFDTSSALWVLTPDKAREIIRNLGTDRVMFGTDYPVMRIQSEIDRLYALDLSDDELSDIFYNNAKRFLKL